MNKERNESMESTIVVVVIAAITLLKLQSTAIKCSVIVSKTVVKSQQAFKKCNLYFKLIHTMFAKLSGKTCSI